MTGIQKVTLFLIKIVLFPSLCNLQVIDTKIKPSLKDLVDLFHSYFHSKVKILTFNIDFSTVKRPAAFQALSTHKASVHKAPKRNHHE